jgi:hypothetical protein
MRGEWGSIINVEYLGSRDDESSRLNHVGSFGSFRRPRVDHAIGNKMSQTSGYSSSDSDVDKPVVISTALLSLDKIRTESTIPPFK